MRRAEHARRGGLLGQPPHEVSRAARNGIRLLERIQLQEVAGCALKIQPGFAPTFALSRGIQ